MVGRAWIGGRATIMPGVTIGAGAVVAAGAVVVRECEPNCVYAGMPAQIIRKIEDEDKDEPADEALLP